jgi:hypothetical protein
LDSTNQATLFGIVFRQHAQLLLHCVSSTLSTTDIMSQASATSGSTSGGDDGHLTRIMVSTGNLMGADHMDTVAKQDLRERHVVSARQVCSARGLGRKWSNFQEIEEGLKL